MADGENHHDGGTGGSLVDVLSMAVRPRAWSTIHLFASPPEAPRSRRPTDTLLAIISFGVLLGLLPTADGDTTSIGDALATVVGAVPGLVDPVWRFLLDLTLVWLVVVALIGAYRRQWPLLWGMIVGVGATVATSVALTRVLTDAWPDIPGDLAGADGPVPFPAAGAALVAVALSVASPHLARPFRRFGRVLWAASLLSTIALEVADPDLAVAGAALGVLVASIVHLGMGSPGGRPTRAEIAAGLADLRLDAAPTTAVRLIDGVAYADAVDRSGRRLLVKVYGRDAWDGQLIASLWRFVFYRDGAPTFSLTRSQQVEHEAVMMFQAERRGASVTPVVASGRSRSGDALLVVQHPGATLATVDAATVDDGLLAAIWAELGALHSTGIVHGRITPESVVVGDGRPAFTGFASSQVALESQLVPIDGAQLLMTLALVVGPERAVASARAHLGAEELAALSSYVQPAALPVALRRAASGLDLDVDDLRTVACAAAGVEPTDLPKLRRVTWGTLAMGVLLFVAGYALITSLVGIGFDTILDALSEAAWGVVLIAFLVGQTPRLANALAVSAASPTPLPFGRVAALQFAITFINLAVPSSAGRIALNIRFFRRAGVNPAAATAIGAIDGVIGFVVQISVLFTILLFGLGSLDLQIDDRIDMDRITSLVLVLVVVLLVVVVVFAAVPRLRALVLDKVRPALAPLTVLRSPRRAVQLFAANLLAEMLFALTMFTVLRAFGQDVSYIDVLLINEAVALFAGLMPVPGGIGVTEAALTAGFVAAGVPESTAFAAALTYRLVTFYVPPILGLPSMRWLQRSGYL